MGILKFTVHWSEEDQEYVGKCSAFPSLSCLESNKKEALLGIQNLYWAEVKSDRKAINSIDNAPDYSIVKVYPDKLGLEQPEFAFYDSALKTWVDASDIKLLGFMPKSWAEQSESKIELTAAQARSLTEHAILEADRYSFILSKLRANKCQYNLKIRYKKLSLKQLMLNMIRAVVIKLKHLSHIKKTKQ